MKPQFSEEEARDFLIDAGVEEKYLEEYMPDLIKNNRIRKSDLEILIEEAEEFCKSWHIKWGTNDLSDLCNKLHDAFTAMKAELNKRREG